MLIAFVGNAIGCSDNIPASAALIETTMVLSATHPYFIHLSDIHLDSYSSHTDYKKDTGTDLWKSTFGSRPGSGQSIADCLKNIQIQSIEDAMNTIYMVKSKTAGSSTKGGIEVKAVPASIH